MSDTKQGDPPIYRATVWESDHGWHWRVEIDIRNGRAWNGDAESFEVAACRAASYLTAAWGRHVWDVATSEVSSEPKSP